MVLAYSYRIQYSEDCYWIYLDEILLATISKGDEGSWYANIKINGDNYLFTKSGMLNQSVNILNVNEMEKLGDISVPLFPLFFRRFIFHRKDGIQMSWFSKNIFSFHWVWKSNNDTLLEAVEDLTGGDRSGVIKLSTYLHESYLLIITGIFLSITRKRKVMFGMFNF